MTNKPMLSVSLLPCPFCGAPAELEDHRLIWCVRCTKCSASILGDRAPEPHGDGVSSDEIQDIQAAAMSDSTDWAAYEKSAVDAWNVRAEKQPKVQGAPAGATHFEECNKCPSTGGIQYYRHDGCCRWSYWPEGLNYWSSLACKPTGDIQSIIVEQPTPLKIGSGVTIENIGFGSEKERKPYLVFGNDGCLTEVNLIDVSLVTRRQVHTVSDLEAVGVRVEQPASVAMMIPRKLNPESLYPDQSDCGWNDCIDEVCRLNGIKP